MLMDIKRRRSKKRRRERRRGGGKEHSLDHLQPTPGVPQALAEQLQAWDPNAVATEVQPD